MSVGDLGHVRNIARDVIDPRGHPWPLHVLHAMDHALEAYYENDVPFEKTLVFDDSDAPRILMEQRLVPAIQQVAGNEPERVAAAVAAAQDVFAAVIAKRDVP